MAHTYFNAIALMDRTMTNLRIIDALYRDSTKVDNMSVYEVTQLVNSFLGALVLPWERLKAFANGEEPWNLTIEDATKEYELPPLNLRFSGGEPPKTFRDVVSIFRNGIAHGNVEYIAGSGDKPKIVAIEVTSFGTEEYAGREWSVYLSVDQMRAFLDCFVYFASESGMPELYQHDIAPR